MVASGWGVHLTKTAFDESWKQESELASDPGFVTNSVTSD